jgi:sensor domain CHASE-containing protein
VRSVDPSGQRRHAGERARFFPVTYVEPLKGNEHIAGFDLASEAGRRAAVEATFDTGTVTATPPIRLVQEQGEQVGILLVFAVHDGSNGAGVVSVALRMGTFMAGLLAPVDSMIHVRLIDLDQEKVPTAVFLLEPAAPLTAMRSPSASGIILSRLLPPHPT